MRAILKEGRSTEMDGAIVTDVMRAAGERSKSPVTRARLSPPQETLSNMRWRQVSEMETCQQLELLQGKLKLAETAARSHAALREQLLLLIGKPGADSYFTPLIFRVFPWLVRDISDTTCALRRSNSPEQQQREICAMMGLINDEVGESTQAQALHAQQTAAAVFAPTHPLSRSCFLLCLQILFTCTA